MHVDEGSGKFTVSIQTSSGDLERVAFFNWVNEWSNREMNNEKEHFIHIHIEGPGFSNLIAWEDFLNTCIILVNRKFMLSFSGQKSVLFILKKFGVQNCIEDYL